MILEEEVYTDRVTRENVIIFIFALPPMATHECKGVKSRKRGQEDARAMVSAVGQRGAARSWKLRPFVVVSPLDRDGKVRRVSSLVYVRDVNMSRIIRWPAIKWWV